jgi:hypothetical protein
VNHQTIRTGEYHDVIDSQIRRWHTVDLQEVARPD